ncbi:chromosome partitioning protein ParA [Vibrio parahaemolyticus]|nr:chromosome partitioning protein ParA [Vibrio parahaemolyticus]
MQLNRSFILKIKNSLEKSAFSADDFEFEFPANDELIIITFSHHPQFQFSIREVQYSNEIKKSKPIQHDIFSSALRGQPKGDETEFITEQIREFEVTMSPGELKSVNQFRESNLGRVTYDIESWCGNIESELIVLYAETPSCDDQLANQIDEMFPNEMLDSEERFTELELEALKENLESLFERIHEIREECNLSEERFKTLQAALNKAQNNAKFYPKGAWLRFNKAKITGSLKKLLAAPEVRQLGYEVIKKIVLKEI